MSQAASVPPSRSHADASVADDPRWACVVARDAAADGRFWYAVTSTGVYCRPSCPSRLAKPANVRLFETRQAAVAAGFRPCRRCHPDGLSVAAANEALVAKACRMIDDATRAPRLADLAAATELSPFYFQRLFKRVTGLTPKAYAVARRSERVRAELVAGRQTVTTAIYNAGFGSSAAFYTAATARLGMTPRRFREGGVDEVLRVAIGPCSLGHVLVASSQKGVAAIFLGADPERLMTDLQRRFPRAELAGGDAEYERLVATVVGFVEASGGSLDLPLDVRGTAFQQRVWQALRAIPAGTTANYAEIAQRLGAPKSARAVAAACAANPLAVAIPCHRVVRRDGSLSGYRWGIERKRVLLEREAGGAGLGPRQDPTQAGAAIEA